MYLLRNSTDGAYRKLYIPQGTGKTDGLAAQIVFNVKENKIKISVGVDIASEKVVNGDGYLYSVSREIEISDRIAELIKEQAKIDSMKKELQPEIYICLFEEGSKK